MKRWNSKLKLETESSKIDEFISKILELSKKYKYSIDHEDSQGAFRIIKYNEKYDEKLKHAHDNTN